MNDASNVVVSNEETAASEQLLAMVEAHSLGDGSSVLHFISGELEAIALKNSYPASFWFHVLPFGSYGLNASVIGSDIDLMVLCSFTVPVQTIVNHFVDRLKASVPDGVMVVDSAKVPVLKFVYHSFPVDIVLVSVVAPSAPSETEMLSNDFLDRIVVESRGNVNGIRTVLQIRRLVPTPLPVFSVVLKAVKLWARARRVYGHLFTYPNGVALAIMVSRVCQVCPSSQISDLFKFFFKFYFSWFSKTDHIYPVYITPSLATGQQRYAGMPSSFDPTNPRCQEDVLPVINPAFPYVNACHTVGKSGLRCFYMELSRAHSILSQETDSLAVRSLMQPIELSAIPFFLLVHVPCYCRGLAECEWNLKLWKGFVESKFRFLIYLLEEMVDVRPFPGFYKTVREERGYFTLEAIYAIGLTSLPSKSVLEGGTLSTLFEEFISILDFKGLHEQSHSFRPLRVVMRAPYLTQHLPSDAFLINLLKSKCSLD